MKEFMRKNRTLLRIGVMVTALALVVVTFTPLILDPGRIQPQFLSMPFTLWTSVLITALLVFLTYVASKLQDDD